MMKKKIAIVATAIVSLAALLIVIAVFLPHVTAETLKGKESYSAFDTMKNLKKTDQEVSVLLTLGTYGSLIIGIVTLLFATLRIINLVAKVEVLNLMNGKFARFLFVMLGISVLVFGFMFALAAGNPVGAVDNSEAASKAAEVANKAWKAMTKVGIGTLLIYVCEIVVFLGIIVSNVTCKKLDS